MLRIRFTVPALVCLASACQPSVPLGLSAADKAAIEAQDATYIKNITAGDATALVKAYYTNDAVFMPPNMPLVTGSAAIEATMKAFPPITNYSLHSDEIAGVGDLAYARGRYTLTLNPPGMAPIPDSGKFIDIWRKQPDGSWKVARDIFNSDVPLAEPAPPAKKK